MTELESDASTMSASDLLRAAARLIERALIQLDTRKSTCGSCGVEHFGNLPHAKAYKQLTDTPDKLQRTADTLEGKGDLPESFTSALDRKRRRKNSVWPRGGNR
jgi:hypothetical protein